MKKGMKKALSILLVMLITLSVAPVGAFTVNAADIDYLTYKIENGEATITACSTEAAGEITIPDEIDGAKVTRIGNSAFRECSLLQKVNIPETVTTIGMQAFNGCTFEEITLPDSVTKISDGLFMYCSSLKKVNLPENLLSIGYQVFYDCINLTEIDIPETVTSIGMQTFYGCESLVSVKIPDGVTVLSNRLFGDCTSLETVSLPQNLTSIGNYAFADCSQLSEINIPQTVTSIGGSAFSDCDALLNVNVPDGVTQISDYLFYNCSSLQSVVLPETITSVGAYAFFNSTLDDVFYYGSEEQWSNITVSSNNGPLKSATIHFNYLPNTGSCGDGVTWNYYEDTKTLAVIGEGAMYDYASSEDCEWYLLKDEIELVIVSEKVSSVGTNAFNGYPKLKEVCLDTDVTAVGEKAFANCSKLSLVSSTASDLSFDTNAFEGCNKRITFVSYSSNKGIIDSVEPSDLISVNFDSTEKTLRFNGELTVYGDLNYEFLNRFVSESNDVEYIVFSKIVFYGVEPEIMDFEDIENFIPGQYLTFTNLCISLKAIKDGASETITFTEMIDLLENGEYDAFIFEIISEEENEDIIVEPTWKESIDNFIDDVNNFVDDFVDDFMGGFVEDVVKATSKLINFISKLFKRK